MHLPPTPLFLATCFSPPASILQFLVSRRLKQSWGRKTNKHTCRLRSVPPICYPLHRIISQEDFGPVVAI